MDPFDQQPSVLLKAEDLQPSLNLPNPHQIVDASGNVLLNGSWEVPGGLNKLSGAVRNYVDYVSNDPTKSLAEIKSLLQNIRPDMEIPKEEREGTPEAMLYPLMEHQKVGLTWLKKMEEGPTKGGILADDMGLGKTIQTLALLVSRPSQDEKRKTTLVVTPVAVLKQWEKEIKKKLKNDHQLSVCIYHCQGKKIKSFADLAQYDVVLTTFGTIASEYKRKEIYLRNMTAGNAGPEPAQIILGKASKFYRVVIDEAQWIKNRDTQSSKGCYSIDAQYRLCLSGTPMQNSCDELFSLLRFLRIKPYNEWSTFAETFSRPLKQKSNYSANQAMSKLQALLKAILLRRTKDSTIDGQPILALPPKEIVMVHAVFSQDEKEFYDALESKSKIQFNKYLRQNAVGRNYSNLLVLLLRLRQACCHPHLINDIEEAKDEGDRDEILDLVHQLSPEVVKRIKQSESLECPVCLDVSDNPSIVIPCGHLFCKECLLQVQTQHEQSNLARGDDNSKLRCPGCRGELDPKRITSLSSFKMVHPPEGDDADRGASGLRRDSDDDLIYDSDSEDEEERDADEYGNLKNSVIPDDAGYGDHPAPKLAAKSKGKGKQKAGRTLAEVRKDAMRNEKSKQLYHKYLQKRWVDSAKVAKCMELLERIQQAHPHEKTIVFSQFTSLLDFLEIPISRKSIEYRRYDGGMSSTKRNQSINDFIDDADVKVLLVSLKAGNSGLNLAVASQVIIFDPFYNPYIELQAIDRAHRIGQQRRVVVHRLVVAGTVEDRVLALQEKKKALIEGALDENAQRGLGRLTAKDLGFLFVRHLLSSYSFMHLTTDKSIGNW
ncbi:SNF2 family N-terminal domain-containing protein [Sphaerosporella brunnea]|uniref:SNF2 family N-terminal domain-containing protein n=1 Tax=Sphaerosporella brunnea TaxID=1250544 RepID=A0A5J5EHM2_9PEZI|nr:SNF2 family N-terminal domain-containing protein [Sphaerosporella brunnea]